MEPRQRQIAYLSAYGIYDKRVWSGTLYYAARALERHCGTVHALGPFDPVFARHQSRVVGLLSRTVTGRRYISAHTTAMAKAHARYFSRRVDRGNYDIVFAPAASVQLAFLTTKNPVFYVSDTTFANMIDYYPYYTNLTASSKKQGLEIEQRAIDRATALLYPSKWAAESALRDFNCDPAKVHVAPLGANLDEIPPADVVLRRVRGETCRLLFLGVDWNKKGGPIAWSAFRHLLEAGLDAQLTICGCVPPSNYVHPRLRVIPYLDKNDPGDYRELVALLMNTDFLLLPTRAECFGIVFCEASAFGVPSVTTATGGTGGAVFEGVNGFRLPWDADGAAYAATISRIWADAKRYQELMRTSRQLYDELLNWDMWGKRVRALMDATLGRG